MTHQVAWSRVIVECFIEEAMLSEEEILVLKTRVQGWSITKQAMELGMSVSKVNQIVNRLKKKYDVAQKHSAILPIRKESAKELWQDQN